ncbi:hypothetical protein CRENBAI_010191 [Crenichthys baileyi]|uniref:Uncharacterized protein n=1 Tax=Crenichthys baileyi TaxID=28760 RepID=A0AAV9RB49_9TELE
MIEILANGSIHGQDTAKRGDSDGNTSTHRDLTNSQHMAQIRGTGTSPPPLGALFKAVALQTTLSSRTRLRELPLPLFESSPSSPSFSFYIFPYAVTPSLPDLP